MSNITRFDPFREMNDLRSMVDQMFDNMIIRQGQTGDFLAMDVMHTDTDVIVKASIPGLKPEDIEISLTNNVLTIQGETKEEENVEKAHYVLREMRKGKYSRSIQLSVPVIADNATAEYDHGILTLNLPKAEEVRPKAITVKVK